MNGLSQCRKMDISVGSTRVPEYSANLSEPVPRVGNGESSKCTEEQNQSQPQAASTQSAVRFKIRTAKERQQSLTKASTLMFEKASRGNKETPKDHTILSPSPETGLIDTRRPKAQSQLSLTKKAEVSVGFETSSTTQKDPDCVGRPTSEVKGGIEWRPAYLSNRSKSLDWKGLKSEGGKENEADVRTNTKDLEGRAIRRSESLERSGAANRPNSNEVLRPLKRVSLQIQAFNGSGQRKQDSNGSSAGSGTSPVRMVALARSFPSRLKANQTQDRTEEQKNPWHSGHSGTKSEQTEHHPKSQVAKVNEITGNHTVMGRSACNVLEDNNEASSGVSHGIITPAPFKLRSFDDRLSFSSSKVKTVSYNSEKCGTFPKTLFKKEQKNLTTLPDTSVVLPTGKDNLATTSTGSEEKPFSQDLRSLQTNNSTYDERRLGTQSLGRARNRYFTTPISYFNNSSNIQKTTREEIERKAEITSSNLKQTKDMETIPGKQPHSSPEGVIPQTKPQSPQSMTANSEKHHLGIGLESGSSENPSKKSEALLEKVQEPTFASVRNRIHKFEALALQNQSSSQIQHHRRAFSVTEKPKAVASVSKTYSDRSLGKRWSGWNRGYLSESLFSKCEDSDEAVGMHDLSGADQTTVQDKVESTMKTQSRETKTHESGAVQTLKLLDEVPSDQKNEAKFTIMNQNMDEPDFAKVSDLKPNQKLENTELCEKKVRSYLSSTKSHNSQKSSGVTDVSHSDLKNFSPKTQTKFFNSTKDKAFLTPESTPVLPDSDTSNPVKSTLLTSNNARSKSPSNLVSDSGVISPIQVLPASASGELSNLYNTVKDEKVAAKVIRWIMDKGVDDENDEDEDEDEDDEGTERGYDSDSGESSVTITSNVSTRSFTMSLVELCSLGGLDLPPSDGSGSNDDENGMSKRTLSISSDVSALSTVTLLEMDELDCLLNDVRALDDDALENYEDVHVTVLHKDAGSGLGFTVAGGVDQNKPVTVHKVIRNGIAAQEGSIHVGDQVLSINGTDLHNSTHKEVMYTMKKARGRTMAVVVIRRGDITETCYSIKESPQKAAGNPGSRVCVTLNKSRSDLGFSLEGGVGSSVGDKPLTVQRLFQGGPVGKVFPGDELLEVEGQSLEGLRRLEVWHLIKRLPPGPVEVLLQRHHQ